MALRTQNAIEVCENNNDIVPELDIVLPKSKDFGKTRVDWSGIDSKLPIDLLLVTATDCEFASCYFYLKNTQRSWRTGLGMVDFGEFGDGQVKVALMRCSGKGANDVRSSLIVVKNAAEILKPKAVICVGCCGIVNPEEAKLGDVVIPTKLATYSNKKITANGKEEWRGVKANVSRNMGDLIPFAADAWEPPLKKPNNFDVKVHCPAVMLSGPELVTNLEKRQKLLEQFSDAIALEMEGEGLYAAAYDLGIEWVVVKGMSNLADGSNTTGNWQPFASTMAASVVHNMFQYSDVIQNWPNYQKPVQGDMSRAVTPAVCNSPTPSLPIEQLLKSIAGTTNGRKIYNGRTIEYSVSGRIHSWKEPWVHDATAKDIATGLTVEKKHFKTADLAINGAIQELVKQLKEQKSIQLD